VLNYAIIGEGAGASKLKALDASKHDIERLDENGLLHLIRNSLDEPERSKQPEVGSLKEQELDIPTGAGAVGSAKGASKRPAAAAAAAPPPVAAAPRDTSADLWTEK
jgi:BRCT domain type II-containing protein